MPKSKFSRLIAFVALLAVALTLAIASAGEPGDGITSGDDPAGIVDPVGFRPNIELHFGW